VSTSPRKQQQRTGRLALLLWLWATLLSPVLHTWHHQADHVHGPAGVVRALALLTVAPSQDAEHEPRYHEAEPVHHDADHEHHHTVGSEHHWHHTAESEHHWHHTAESEHRHHQPHDSDRHPDHRHGKGPPPPSPHGQGSAAHFQLALIHQALDLRPLGLFTLLPRALAAQPIDQPDPRIEAWIERSRGPPAPWTT
jgi:hypothetical protein